MEFDQREEKKMPVKRTYSQTKDKKDLKELIVKGKRVGEVGRKKALVTQPKQLGAYLKTADEPSALERKLLSTGTREEIKSDYTLGSDGNMRKKTKQEKKLDEDIAGIKKPLTPLQHRFVVEYLRDGNAAGAYARARQFHSGRIDAGDPRDLTPANCARYAYSLLQHDHVLAAIKVAQQKLVEKAMLGKEDIVQMFMEIQAEARVAKKFDAAVRAVEKLGEISGILNPKKGSLEESIKSSGKNAMGTSAFLQTIDVTEVDKEEVNEDIMKYLSLVDIKATDN